VPKGYWSVLENQKQYFDWLGKELGVNTLDDWYKVKLDDVRSRSG
jgi:hypothetical protein